MKWLLLRLVLFTTLATSGWAETSAVPLNDVFSRELKSLAGTWRPVYAENNGVEAPEAALKGTRWIRAADGTWVMKRGDEILVRWAVKKIDATKTPKAIDLEVAAGPYKGVIYLGIYELDSDTLRICFALPDRPVRPSEFSARKGSVRALSVFKRENN